MGTSDANPWTLMLCNLAYTPAFQWYIKNIPFNETYYERQLDIDMGEDTTKKPKANSGTVSKLFLIQMRRSRK